MPECPICASQVPRPTEGVDFSGHDCPRCGRWSVRLDASGIEFVCARQIGQWAEALRRRSRLSHIYRRQQTGETSRWVEIPVDNWTGRFLDAQPLPTPSEQLDNLILWVGDHQPSIAESTLISIPAISAWIGASITRDSPGATIGWLLGQQTPKPLIEDKSGPDGLKRLRLTMAGWNRYEALKRGHIESRKAMMAMKFDRELKTLLEAFRVAVSRAGFELFTIEAGPAGSIDDQLRVALRVSRFIIADLTHGNPGAYWESGYVEGLGRPVIYTCRKKEWDKEKTCSEAAKLDRFWLEFSAVIPLAGRSGER
jgi:hypothetical protein